MPPALLMQSPPAPPRTQPYAEPYAAGVGDEYGAAWKVSQLPSVEAELWEGCQLMITSAQLSMQSTLSTTQQGLLQQYSCIALHLEAVAVV